MMYRAESLLRGHQTNNFAEANMTIIKYVILNRLEEFIRHASPDDQVSFLVKSTILSCGVVILSTGNRLMKIT